MCILSYGWQVKHTLSISWSSSALTSMNFIPNSFANYKKEMPIFAQYYQHKLLRKMLNDFRKRGVKINSWGFNRENLRFESKPYGNTTPLRDKFPTPFFLPRIDFINKIYCWLSINLLGAVVAHLNDIAPNFPEKSGAPPLPPQPASLCNAYVKAFEIWSFSLLSMYFHLFERM